MCLIVKELPATSNDFVTHKCWKKLIPRNYCYKTWFRLTTVPDNGLLVPDRPTGRAKLYYNDEINGGYIHAYQDWSDQWTHNAIALNVVAFDPLSLACEALWIPDCAIHHRFAIHKEISKLETRTQARKFIKRWSS